MATLKNPLWFFALTVILACGLLTLPISLPIGPMYWDLFLYFDGAQRILNGQIPSVDFSTPVGPLSYYLTFLAMRAFPNTNPFLLVEWSFLIITSPAMAIIINQVARTSWPKAWALLLPFLFYSIAPFNVINLIPHTGIEAWGIYNRHSIQLLYVLLAALLFLPSPRWRIAIIGYLVIALFVTKITGFLAGGLILFGFFLAGQISRSLFVGANIIFWVSLAIAEISLGIVSGYLTDVLALISRNQSNIIYRFFSVGVTQFDIIFAGTALSFILLIDHLKSPLRPPAYLLGVRQTVIRFCNTDWFICGTLIFAGLAFETQNSGGQPFVFMWPFLMKVLWRDDYHTPFIKNAIIIAIAFVMIPAASITLHKSARAVGAMALYEPLKNKNLNTLGLVSTSKKFYDRTDALRQIYIDNEKTYEASIKAGTEAVFLIHAQPDFQMFNLKEIDKAITAIHELERKSGKIFETVWNVDFANPIGWLMQRHGPKYVPIGMDPTRTIVPLDNKRRKALADVDLALIPTCPATKNRTLTEKHYVPAFTNHRRIELTACMDALIKK
ncbi:MAG: hypothetical protein ABJM86_09555 [Hyphomicrobiales bacterium]